MKEIMPKIESISKPEAEPREIDTYVHEFCSGWKPETDEEIEIFEKTKQKLEESLLEFGQKGSRVSYDKHKKEFKADDGRVVPKSYFSVAPIWGKNFSFEDVENMSFEYKQMKSMYRKAWVKEQTANIFSPTIARVQSQRERKQDIFLSEAYSKLADRFEQETNGVRESLGSQAERVVRSFLTRISAEMQDLKISIHPANPYQDVSEKIDFIIEATSKKRGVGIEADENISQTVGIQFTVNNSKLEYKQDQINKAKNRALDVDDIILVSMSQDVLSKALDSWQKKGDLFEEPAESISSSVREQLIRQLFRSLVNEEEISLIVKKYC